MCVFYHNITFMSQSVLTLSCGANSQISNSCFFSCYKSTVFIEIPEEHEFGTFTHYSSCLLQIRSNISKCETQIYVNTCVMRLCRRENQTAKREKIIQGNQYVTSSINVIEKKKFSTPPGLSQLGQFGLRKEET